MQPKMARDFYNLNASLPWSDAAVARALAAHERRCAHLAPLVTAGLRTLDLGCFAGRLCFALERMGATPTGIDCAEVPLRQAAERAEERGSHCRFVRGDYVRLPFAPASFDLAILPKNLVECSYTDIDAMARQLRTILVPGGRFCVEMHDELLKVLARGSTAGEYDPSSGRMRSRMALPGREEVTTDCYFWTTGFAKHVIGRHLVPESEECPAENDYWLLYANR